MFFSSKWVYTVSRRSFIQFSLQNLRVLQFLREGCKLCRYDKTNLPLSLPSNCCSKEIKNKRRTEDTKKLNKRRGAYSSKYGSLRSFS